MPDLKITEDPTVSEAVGTALVAGVRMHMTF